MPYSNMIRESLKRSSEIPVRAYLLVFLALSFVILCPACVTREEVRAYVWLNNGLPPDLCEREPALRDYGFYRRLDSGRYEFLSFCSKEAKDFFGVHKDDFERILDATLPKGDT